MKKIKYFILIAQLLLSSLNVAYTAPAVEVGVEVKTALVDLKNYCEDVSQHPINYAKNSKDKSVLSVPVETAPGVVKYDTFIKVDHPNGPSYISCFQNFKTPFKPISLAKAIALEEEKLRTCTDCRRGSSEATIDKTSKNVKKITEKMMCEESKKTSLPQCANDLAYCGLENLHLTKAIDIPKSRDLKCGTMLDGQKDLGQCMAIFIRGAFNEITDTLKLLVVDGPKWIYNKTLGSWFQEPAVKQMENVGSMEAIASSTATDKQIKQEIAEPKKALMEKISTFAQNLILEKGVAEFGCSEWSTGVPGIGKCVSPPASWECSSCKQKAMTLCGVAGYATGMVVETAVLAAPIGVIAGSGLAVIGVVSKTAKVAKVTKALKVGEIFKGSEIASAAKNVTKVGVDVSKAAIKLLAPIASTGYKIGKGTVEVLKLIPGVELTAKVLSTPFKLWMKADDILISKVWSLTYHGSAAYTQTLMKTGDIVLAAKSAQTASKLNQAEKAGEALLKTQSELKVAEEKLATATEKKEAKVAKENHAKLQLTLTAQQKRYTALNKSITPAEINSAKLLESEHTEKLVLDYNKVQASILERSPAKVEEVVVAEQAVKAETLAETTEAGLVAGPTLKFTTREESADALAKIIAVDEEMQKLISDPIIAQYIYLNHFAPVKEQNELKIALQDIVNSSEHKELDLFDLVNKKLESKIKDPAIQAKVKAAFEGSDKGLRPTKLNANLYEIKSKMNLIAKMPWTISRIKKLTDEGFALEVMDEGLFHFYGATQLGLRESQMRPWELIPGGFSAIRPGQIEDMSPEFWAGMARFASETEAPIHGYSTNSGDALRGLIPSISRFMGKNEEEYGAFNKAVEETMAKGGKESDVGQFCTNVWCGEENRHENAVEQFANQVSGQKKEGPKTYEADKRGDYMDPEYGLKHLVGRNSSEWNANSIYIYMRSHSNGAANKWVDQVRQDETKHMAIFASAFKYFYGDQPGVRTKGMIDKIMDLKKQAATSNSSGDILSGNAPVLLELGVTHLFVENKVRQFMKSVPLKTMEKIFDSPVKTLRDLDTLPLTAEKKVAILEMNERELANRAKLSRWTPKERGLYLSLKKVEEEKGELIGSLIETLFDGFRGAEIPESAASKAMIAQIEKLKTGLDPKTNALIQMSLKETMRDYQIMNNKFVRNSDNLKVKFKNAREGFIVEKKGPGEAAVIKTEKLTDSTILLRVKKPADMMDLKPGQGISVAIKTADGIEKRVFSLASNPDKDYVEFGIGLSDTEFKKSLQKLKPGETVTLTKTPAGMDFFTDKPAIMIAGGVGITPFRSMMQYAKDNKLKTPMHLYYSNRSQIPFGKEFSEMAATTPELNVTNILSKADDSWAGKRGRIDEPFLTEEIKTLPKDSKYYVVGPPAMVIGTKDNLIKLGVKPEDIQIEFFEAPKQPERATAATDKGADVAPATDKTVCHCFSVPESKIIQVIKGGATTLDDIASQTGASRGCGKCACSVSDVLTCEMKKMGK
ncbi:MAG: (2Fe-2S)-binding protein [Bacteriovorax sp.]|nr:(2Fe-2S)-binding protein [Bacteriovorax sp.]